MDVLKITNKISLSLKTRIKRTALCGLLCLAFPAFAQINMTPKQLLIDMNRAQEQLNYEYSFVQSSVLDINTYQYRHIHVDGKSYAQLATLNGLQQEILLQHNMVSYLHPNSPSFTIKSSKIIDNFPNILNANIDKISRYYDFVALGRNRMAGHLVQTIRIVPKDNFRYQYVVFVDEESHLLLGSDMLDQDADVIERFRVVNFYVGDEEIEPLRNYLGKLNIPPMLVDKSEAKRKFKWQVKWLPSGFTLLSQKVENVGDQNDQIESRLYSDGLFSFTVYVANNSLPDKQEGVWKQGSFTIYSETVNDKEITVIGQIPLTTAKRIAQEVKLGE
ncbi:sigma-E factor regulatory protein RseB [Pasteurellaceae bacterium LIM206]|nr:sigma-E factor regulatory protein RseB [Pasteurellaceae bacterium LIM206]